MIQVFGLKYDPFARDRSEQDVWELGDHTYNMPPGERAVKPSLPFYPQPQAGGTDLSSESLVLFGSKDNHPACVCVWQAVSDIQFVKDMVVFTEVNTDRALVL